MPPTDPRREAIDNALAAAFSFTDPNALPAIAQGLYDALVPPTDPTAALRTALDVDDVMDWLRRFDGRVEDIFALWTQGKRDDRWVAETLIAEGHIAALASQADDPSGPDVEAAWAEYDIAFVVNCIPWERDDLRKRVEAAIRAQSGRPST